jgi:hypothetical protein
VAAALNRCADLCGHLVVGELAQHPGTDPDVEFTVRLAGNSDPAAGGSAGGPEASDSVVVAAQFRHDVLTPVQAE